LAGIVAYGAYLPYFRLDRKAIGDALGTTEETVKNSLFRATRKLRHELGGLR